MFNSKTLLWQTLIVCSIITRALQSVIGDVRCNKPADIYFVLDASASIWGPDFKKQLAFVNSVINELDQSVVRCGLLTYGDVVRVEFDLKTYEGRRDALTNAVSSVPQLRGDTRTDKALHRMREMLLQDAREVPRIAIVMTDGKSNYPKLTKQEAELTHKSGITTFAIGIGKYIDAEELKSIASHEDFLFTVDNFDALAAIKIMLREKACEVKFAPAPINLDGCEQNPTDVVLMLDSSSNVRSKDFSSLLKFASDLASYLPLSPTEVRVGVMTYSNVPRQQFSLEQYTSPEQISKAILRIDQHQGRPNTGAALRLLRQHSFSASRHREGVRKIAIVITSNSPDSQRAIAYQAQLLRDDEIRVFAVGVGPEVSDLATIASYPSDQHLMTVNSYDDLHSIKTLLAGKICVMNNGNYAALERGDDIVWERTSTTESTTTLTTTQELTSTRTTPTTTMTTTPPPRGCGNARPADIVFSIPSTANSYQTTEALEFIRSVAERMTVSSSAVRIGLAPRSCLSLPGFMLDQGTDKSQVLNMFETTYHKTMTSDTASTIRHLRNVSFKKENGARDNSKKIGILIVDSPVRNFIKAVEESVLAKEENIELFVIGAGSQASVDEMTMLASQNSQQTVMTVASYSHLKRLTKGLIYAANQRCIHQ